MISQPGVGESRFNIQFFQRQFFRLLLRTKLRNTPNIINFDNHITLAHDHRLYAVSDDNAAPNSSAAKQTKTTWWNPKDPSTNIRNENKREQSKPLINVFSEDFFEYLNPSILHSSGIVTDEWRRVIWSWWISAWLKERWIFLFWRELMGWLNIPRRERARRLRRIFQRFMVWFSMTIRNWKGEEFLNYVQKSVQFADSNSFSVEWTLSVSSANWIKRFKFVFFATVFLIWPGNIFGGVSGKRFE